MLLILTLELICKIDDIDTLAHPTSSGCSTVEKAGKEELHGSVPLTDIRYIYTTVDFHEVGEMEMRAATEGAKSRWLLRSKKLT